MSTNLQPSSAFPIGATARPGGVNFSIYADKSGAVELLLFDGVDDPQPAQVFRLDPEQHRTYTVSFDLPSVRGILPIDYAA